MWSTSAGRRTQLTSRDFPAPPRAVGHRRAADAVHCRTRQLHECGGRVPAPGAAAARRTGRPAGAGRSAPEARAPAADRQVAAHPVRPARTSTATCGRRGGPTERERELAVRRARWSGGATVAGPRVRPGPRRARGVGLRRRMVAHRRRASACRTLFHECDLLVAECLPVGVVRRPRRRRAGRAGVGVRLRAPQSGGPADAVVPVERRAPTMAATSSTWPASCAAEEDAGLAVHPAARPRVRRLGLRLGRRCGPRRGHRGRGADGRRLRPQR